MAKETPDLSGLFGNLLSNPGALSALSGIIGGLGSAEKREEPPTEERKGEEAATGAPPLSAAPLLHGGGGRHQKREGLLGALRPYLSPRRAQALEGACKLLEVIELFRTGRGGNE